jgi:crotonobetainyl-CoA:carnitine CoA-transferase CaiB-like acyl-CoA transferase
MEELGLGYNTLCEVNPRLIYGTLTGYGPDGPYAKFPGCGQLAVVLEWADCAVPGTM